MHQNPRPLPKPDKELRDCCGCSCLICEGGHLEGWHHGYTDHTQGCKKRFWDQVDREIRDYEAKEHRGHGE